MITKCPECDLQVSDKASTCPHCGFPLKKESRKSIGNKRRRLPNGFGQITELKGQNLRNPFRASVTVGKDIDGKCIKKTLKPNGYFPTYNDAYEALVQYNKNPYDLDTTMTMEELYNVWSTKYFKKLKSASSMRTITAAWKYCDSVKKMRVMDIRARHIKGCMEGNGKEVSVNMKSRIKSMFNLMLDYAVEYEIVDKNYARTFTISEDIQIEKERNRKIHIPFTETELKTLWCHKDMPYVDIVLIQCYTGWRPQELGLLKTENIDLKNGWMKGGMKTTAGINRSVPIHSRIQDLVEEKYKNAVKIDSPFLLTSLDGTPLTYNKYQKRFYQIRDELHLNQDHRPHDGRVTFVTRGKKYGMDEYAIKYIVGHAINDITEKIYTKREKSWLKEEIEKLM